jgi:hypothetical protein
MNLNTFLKNMLTEYKVICALFKSSLRIFFDIKNISLK